VIAGRLLAHWLRFSKPIALPDTERLLIEFNCVLLLLLFPGFGVDETWRGKALPSMLARVAAAWMVVVFTAFVLAFTRHRTDQVYGYMRRYRIKPGITGWAQVNGYRGAAAKVEKIEARVKFDLFYIHSGSFCFDMKIVFVTMFKGVVNRNAF
jgi:hypothetical protein